MPTSIGLGMKQDSPQGALRYLKLGPDVLESDFGFSDSTATLLVSEEK
jgi:hypothetical protein